MAPKFFKVVANAKKKLVAIFKDKQNLFFFFYAVSVLDRPSKIKFYKVLQSSTKFYKVLQSSTKFYKVDTRMSDIQCSSSPKSKIASNYQLRCMCCVLEIKQT